MHNERLAMLRKLEEQYEGKVLVYVTGDRPGLGASIAGDVYETMVEHLDQISDFGRTNRLLLYLYTRGGDTLAARAIVNLLRQFCHELWVIVPLVAHSAGTLMCLAADRVVMTKQATLGPIDQSIKTPLNPQIPGSENVRALVSVEAIKGFIDLAKNEFGIDEGANLTPVLLGLAGNVHPLVLGEVYRAKHQIERLAQDLMRGHIEEEDTVAEIIKFLCSESGSHDYTINRSEAKELKLPVDKPDLERYKAIRTIYANIRKDLSLDVRYHHSRELGDRDEADYSLRRALVESVEGGCHYCVSEGVLRRGDLETGQPAIEDDRQFDGWRKVVHNDNEQR